MTIFIRPITNDIGINHQPYYEGLFGLISDICLFYPKISCDTIRILCLPLYKYELFLTIKTCFKVVRTPLNLE